ncbi:MAG: alkaline shock response membrane anchor protein AmaP [Oscillospiraceae bacterium]|jgi:uncharacterized alkaline shock family protein YloU|nr:alkaline shock response membrane anchor protein AmaP [Oscillospiraceae bacterium]
MRIRWYDRVLIALSGLLLLALGTLLVMTGLREPKVVADLGIKIIQAPFGFAAAQSIRAGAWYTLAALIASGLVLALWGIRQWISLIPKRQREAFFTATEVERGTLTIARPALEHLVRKCVAEHPEMTVSKIHISSENEKATVRLRATMRSGVSMPKVTASLQKEIISYMSECAGVSVASVQVIVEDTTPPLLLPEGAAAQRAALPQPEPKQDTTPEPEAVPIPLGSFVDDEPAVPVMASIVFPGAEANAPATESHEADETEPRDTIGDSPAIDPMFSMEGRIDPDPKNGEEDEGDTPAVSEGGYSNDAGS